MTANEKMLQTARDRYKLATDAEADVHAEMLEDIRFEAGEQWPQAIRHMRETDKDGARPCLVVNMSRKHKNALLNDIRRNRPSIKVLPVDEAADVETAKILNGMIRHISAASDADIATDTAADGQITIGVGYFRVGTEIVNDATGEQEIRILPVVNPFAVHMDPFADHPAGADAQWAFIDVEMSREEFADEYPDAELSDYDGAQKSGMALWYPSDTTVRVAEYWMIKKVKPSKEWPFKTRCCWYKIAGGDQLLDKRELPCQYIPVIRAVGEERRYDNKRDFRGIIRDLRDPQRMYNYWTSANTEAIALAPKSPYIGPAEAFEGHENAWANANTSNTPYLTYNQYAQENGEKLDKPERSQPAQVNTGIVQSMLQAAEDMRQVSGQSQSAFGERGNETSGRAINARRQEQDTNTFHFVDNLARAIKHAGRIIVQMIPFVYDTRRVVRVLGEDDTSDSAQLDPTAPRAMVEQADALGKIRRIYNPTIGRYDVRVTVGPNYATRAEEGAERLSQVIQSAPDMLAIAGDLLFKSMDIPGAEELSERMKAMLPPQIQQLNEAKQSGQAQGMAMAEQVRQQMIQQIGPMVEELKGALDMAAQENEQLRAMTEDMKRQLDDKQAEMQLKQAELAIKGREAQLKHDAEMADAEAEVAVAMINARAGSEQPRNSEPKDASGAVANTAAAVAAQQSAQAIQAVAAQIVEQLQQVAAIAQGAAQAVIGVQSAQQATQNQTATLETRLAQQDAMRERITGIAAGLLAGKLTEQDAAAAIGKLH